MAFACGIRARSTRGATREPLVTIFFSFFWGSPTSPTHGAVQWKFESRPGGKFSSWCFGGLEVPKKEKGRVLKGPWQLAPVGSWGSFPDFFWKSRNQKWMVCYRKIPWFWEVPQNLGERWCWWRAPMGTFDDSMLETWNMYPRWLRQ